MAWSNKKTHKPVKRGKMNGRQITELPQGADEIIQLRKHLSFSQAELGERLGYSAMAVSRWERGLAEPAADVFIQLGNLAGEPDCWFFWERAGLKSSDILRLIPDGLKQPLPSPHPIEVVTAGVHKKTQSSKEAQLFAIPVLDVHASSPGEGGDKVADFARLPADERIAATSAWCPNPVHTSCLRVHGNSMSPLINDGDVVAVDYSPNGNGDLNGKIVIASHETRGLSIARFRKYHQTELLEPENREYEPIQVNGDRSWKIVGKVLWWIRKAP